MPVVKNFPGAEGCSSGTLACLVLGAKPIALGQQQGRVSTLAAPSPLGIVAPSEPRGLRISYSLSW